MEFSDKNKFNKYIKQLKILGFGSQGVAYLDKNLNEVTKVFHDFYIEDGIYITREEEDILKFKSIDTNTFYFPFDIVKVSDEILGYKMKFANGKLLYKINPLGINYDNFFSAVEKAKKDIDYISQNNVKTFDVSYNVLYDGKVLSIIDSDDYSLSGLNKEDLLKFNNYNFNKEVLDFIISGLFEEFIESNKDLNDLHKDNNIDILLFLSLFKKNICEYIGVDIKYLNEAKSLINKRKHKSSYQRCI